MATLPDTVSVMGKECVRVPDDDGRAAVKKIMMMFFGLCFFRMHSKHCGPSSLNFEVIWFGD